MTTELEKKIADATNHPQLAFLREVRATLPKAEWFLVGGAVRDIALGRVAVDHDFDLVVRGVGLDEVSDALGRLGKVSYVGRDFGVLKFWSAKMPDGSRAVDIAWPRTERAGGTGARRDFEVHSDPDLPIADDLARRDFTINAMAWDFATARLIDPHGGLADLDAKVIRAVGEPEQRFAEDYSRILRGVRFACELGFEIEERTWEASTNLSRHLNDVWQNEVGETERVVPYEIVASEFMKALAVDANRAIDLLEKSGILFRLLPELARLSGLVQPAEWHSEGDVWQHTKLALRKITGPEFNDVFPDESPSMETLIAVLLHDSGKAEATKEVAGHITFHGHDAIGATLARGIVERLRLSSVERFGVRSERIGWLVRQHMFPILVDLDHVRKTTLERYFLSDEVAGRQLLHLAFADLSASVPESGEPKLDNLLRLMEELTALKAAGATESKSLISGEDVMAETGLTPGPEIGRLLEEIREAQLSGEIRTDEEAKELLRRKLG